MLMNKDMYYLLFVTDNFIHPNPPQLSFGAVAALRPSLGGKRAVSTVVVSFLVVCVGGGGSFCTSGGGE